MITSDVSDDSHDTSHSITGIKNKEESFSPYIQCWVEDEEVELLVDTGATINVLTKKLINVIIRKDPTFPQLPYNGVRISNAVGKQICKVPMQIFCRGQFNDAVSTPTSYKWRDSIKRTLSEPTSSTNTTLR